MFVLVLTHNPKLATSVALGNLLEMQFFSLNRPTESETPQVGPVIYVLTRLDIIWGLVIWRGMSGFHVLLTITQALIFPSKSLIRLGQQAV